MIGYIYTLSDPRTDFVRYVGQTVDVKGRYSVHVSPFTKGDKSRRRAWIEELLDARLKPALIVVEECDLGVLNEREAHWIEHYKSLGTDLVNADPAGAGMSRLQASLKRSSELTAERNRQRRGTPMRAEVRSHLSAVHKARLAALTPEERLARVASAIAKRKPGYNKGWKHSAKSKAAIGFANSRKRQPS